MGNLFTWRPWRVFTKEQRWATKQLIKLKYSMILLKKNCSQNVIVDLNEMKQKKVISIANFLGVHDKLM